MQVGESNPHNSWQETVSSCIEDVCVYPQVGGCQHSINQEEGKEEEKEQEEEKKKKKEKEEEEEEQEEKAVDLVNTMCGY